MYKLYDDKGFVKATSEKNILILLIFLLFAYSFLFVKTINIFFFAIYVLSFICFNQDNFPLIIKIISIPVRKLKSIFFENIEYFFIIFIFTGVSFTIVLYSFEKNLINTLKFFLTMGLTHLVVTFFPYESLNRILMKNLFHYEVYIKKRTDLLSSNFPDKPKDDKKKKNKIYLYITYTGTYFNTEQDDDTLEKILNRYIELIMFWYSTTYNRFKFRFLMTVYFAIVSIIYFMTIFKIIEDARLDNINIAFLVIVSVIFLGFLMIVHLNSFLNTNSYMDKIKFHFKNFYFKSSTNEQKIIYFFQRNFSVFIDDTRANRRINLNSNKQFLKMIKKRYFDEDGRNLIVAVFLSLFFILYLELSISILTKSNVVIEDDKRQQNKKEGILKNGENNATR